MRKAFGILWIFLLGFFGAKPVFAQNQPLIDSLLQVLNTNIQGKERVDLYVKITREYKYFDSLNTAKYAKLAIQLAEAVNYPEGKIDALGSLAWTTMEVGHYAEAENLFKQVIRESISVGYKTGQARGLNGLGNVIEYQGNYEQAIQQYLQSLQINQEIGNQKDIAGDYNDIGVAYYYQGNYALAVEYYFHSLKIKEEIGDKKGMASGYNNIGIIYDKQKNYTKALEYYLLSLKITEELGHKNGMAKNYNNIGLSYFDLGDHKKALRYFFQSLKIKEEIGDKRGIANCYHNLADVYYEEKKYQKALAYALKDLKLSQELGAKDYIASSLLLIGDIYQKQGKTQLAKEYLGQAFVISKKSGNTLNLKEVALALSLVEKELGNYQAAYEAHVLYKQMADSLQNEEVTETITRLEAEYQFKQEKDSIQIANQAERIILEKDINIRKNFQLATFVALGLLLALALILFWFFRSKSRSNTLLSKKTEDLKTAHDEILAQKKEITLKNKQLEDLNGLKDRIFSIVAHDLRSPIESLQSLLRLFKSDHDISQEEMSEWLDRLAENVEGVSGLLKNLLYWAHAQMHGETSLSPSPQNLRPYIQEVVQLLGESALSKGIQTQVDVEENLPELLVDPEILRFLLRNLINNAYKFSHMKGQVYILARLVSENLVKILVRDQGVGMDEVRKHELFKGLVNSKNGTRAEQGTGLGLMLCREFVEQSGGNIGVDSELGKGSTFWFTLPVSALPSPLLTKR